MTFSVEKSLTISRPFSPNVRSFSRSFISSSIFSAIIPLSPTGTRYPLTPSSTASLLPRTSVATIGLPIAIARPDVKVTLLDSLNKRIGFLREVCKELDINADCIHDRAEDGGRNPALREKFDIAVSRAVARVSPLAEYTVPFVKVGGRSLMYKGPQAAAELKEGERALELLCCTGEIRSYPAEWGERSVIILTKQKPTAKAYPRKAGTAEKKPL